jgi:hypothetical protein
LCDEQVIPSAADQDLDVALDAIALAGFTVIGSGAGQGVDGRHVTGVVRLA